MKLTEEQIKEQIDSVIFRKIWKKTTLCLMTLKNGFEIITTSACIDPENYDQEIWEKISLGKAMDKLRELEWYKNS